jgi:hydroxyacylglutathione hydrolase
MKRSTVVSRSLMALGHVFWLSMSAATATDLTTKEWIHGSADCESNRDPPFEVFEFDASTFILRQNKCVNYEAPFIYVLVGDTTVFVQDTGATPDATMAPIYDTVRRIVAKQTSADKRERRILVTHSHSHGDHTAGDLQFRGKAGVTVVEPKGEAVRKHFGLADWPNGVATVDLGGRLLSILPAPGHQDESVAVYDSRTGWLLTGDSVYPGQLYVKDWNVYRASIRRLVEFAKTHRITAVMGTHIEMSRTPGKLFSRGSTFQPNEAPLPLSLADLQELDRSLSRTGDEPNTIPADKFVVVPIGMLQRIVSTVVGWFSD